MNETDRIRVLLVDDQSLFRQAIATLVNSQPDMEVTGQAADGSEGLVLAASTHPDVVLLDIDMPGLDGIETARELVARGHGGTVVMLTVNDDDATFLAAIRAGAHGYLLKDLHPDELFDQIRSAHAGQSPISPSLLPRMMEHLRALPHDGAEPRADEPPHGLSARELEILELVADGLTNREIGRRLFITEGTVKNHVHNSLRKLGVDNRIQAAALLNGRR